VGDTRPPAPGAPSPVEHIKADSRRLRGTLVESLADPLTGAIREDDTQLIKFHGVYQQDDRDLRQERRANKLEPAFQFMVRARMPGGLCTPAQWLAFDEIARTHANGTLRLTTRQAFQLHGVLKHRLKPTIAAINRTLLDTLAACGDVNRNVMCSVLPSSRAVHAAAVALAAELSRRFLPQTGAYHEIWLDGTRVAASGDEDEPVYGPLYLPRKFKLGIAVPPDNDVDIHSQDLGLVAIVEAGRIAGYNVLVGGGMGMTHGDYATWPRVADDLGFCAAADALAVAEAVLTTQRDFGDRSNRRHARLKYTVEDLGLARFRAEVEARAGVRLAPPRPVRFRDNADPLGWRTDDEGHHHFGLYVPSGRIVDRDDWRALTGLREVAARGLAAFRLSANQNLMLCDVPPTRRTELAELLEAHGLARPVSAVRRLALACVGMPTCGLAMAESERYAPEFLAEFERLLVRHGLGDAAIGVRITGCPNGCARPFLAEVALVGKAPGRYNLYVGGAPDGSRLNVPLRENITQAEVLAVLDGLLQRYAGERAAGEDFGGYVRRAGIVAAIDSGRGFAAAARALGTAP
jgi:sulfite reductase (NADPH) hemoprotein beta-component